MFSEKETLEIQYRGLQLENVEKQIKRFETGFVPLNIVAPATIEHGIKTFDKDEIEDFAKLYDKKKKHKKINTQNLTFNNRLIIKSPSVKI